MTECFCINCRHYRADPDFPDPAKQAEFARCAVSLSENDKRLRRVDGRAIGSLFCTTARMDGTGDDVCGPDAKLFAPKLEAVS